MESTNLAPGSLVLIPYTYDSSNDRITIRPSASFLEQRAKGGPVLEGFLDPEDPLENPFQWIAVKNLAPTVSVKVVNNSSQTIYISDAMLRVNSSKVNYDPVLFFLSAYGPEFTIRNEGWGRVVNPQLRFGFADAGSCHETVTWSDENFTKQLATFVERTDVNINDELPESYRVVDPIHGKTICLFGTLTYQTENNELQTLKLKVPIHIGGPRKFGEYGVSKSDPIYGVYLPPGESSYERHISMAQVIKAGEADHFSIRLYTTKSCDFDIDFYLRTTEGTEVSRKKIVLDVFVPRSAKN